MQQRLDIAGRGVVAYGRKPACYTAGARCCAVRAACETCEPWVHASRDNDLSHTKQQARTALVKPRMLYEGVALTAKTRLLQLAQWCANTRSLITRLKKPKQPMSCVPVSEKSRAPDPGAG